MKKKLFVILYLISIKTFGLNIQSSDTTHFTNRKFNLSWNVSTGNCYFQETKSSFLINYFGASNYFIDNYYPGFSFSINGGLIITEKKHGLIAQIAFSRNHQENDIFSKNRYGDPNTHIIVNAYGMSFSILKKLYYTRFIALSVGVGYYYQFESNYTNYITLPVSTNFYAPKLLTDFNINLNKKSSINITVEKLFIGKFYYTDTYFYSTYFGTNELNFRFPLYLFIGFNHKIF